MDGRSMVTALINSIPNTDPTTPQTSNPLQDLPQESRNIFLTLHALFEKELLPALDLLDRSLITRLKTSESDRTCTLHLVRSAQAQTSKTPHHEPITHYYEVRLQAWSCSCPAFTFSAFPAASDEKAPPANMNNEETWKFGGLTLDSDMPVCKHLLACVLAEKCQMFSHFVEERQITREEMAGWAAGWGG
ncbi:hypothetical protein AC578_293 [Pseudocercospora eumusae]|uniref:SWIM-type domain-containing protein n=1 Tax=Pseudocercospora eumusae TaxID=321146 RepID=A0A139HTX5_9PEZI|nr:hypothetical protein AC578_293 [Pseudocercospora eumusae]